MSTFTAISGVDTRMITRIIHGQAHKGYNLHSDMYCLMKL